MCGLPLFCGMTLSSGSSVASVQLRPPSLDDHLWRRGAAVSCGTTFSATHRIGSEGETFTMRRSGASIPATGNESKVSPASWETCSRSPVVATTSPGSAAQTSRPLNSPSSSVAKVSPPSSLRTSPRGVAA